jgi:hypothetical protein
MQSKESVGNHFRPYDLAEIEGVYAKRDARGEQRVNSPRSSKPDASLKKKRSLRVRPSCAGTPKPKITKPSTARLMRDIRARPRRTQKKPEKRRTSSTAAAMMRNPRAAPALRSYPRIACNTSAMASRLKAQRNFTDPDSRIMVTGGAFVQAYNAQTMVDAHAQVIVAAALSNQPAETARNPRRETMNTYRRCSI